MTDRPDPSRSDAAGSAAPPRWGLGAFVAVWIAGLVAGTIGFGVAAAASDTDSGEDLPLTWLFAVALPAQNLAYVAAAWAVSRWRGTGSMRRDFGFELRPSHWRWILGGVAAQAVLVVVVALVSVFVDLGDEGQELVTRLEEERTGSVVVVAFLATTVLAPVAEELVYRGMLLRALGRWMPPGAAIAVSAAIFASVHLTGVEGGAGAVVVIVGLFALALLLGWLAVRDGSLSRPILVHAGFNAVTTAAALFA